MYGRGVICGFLFYYPVSLCVLHVSRLKKRYDKDTINYSDIKHLNSYATTRILASLRNSTKFTDSYSYKQVVQLKLFIVQAYTYIMHI